MTLADPAALIAEAVERKCRWQRAYSYTPCGRQSDGDFCEEHRTKVCSGCGGQAVKECSYAGQFVCGYPICGTCVGTQGDSTKGLGWGFIGHEHVPADAAMRAAAQRGEE